MPEPSDSALPAIIPGRLEDDDLLEVCGGVGATILETGNRWNIALPLYKFDFSTKSTSCLNVSKTMPASFLLGRITRWKDLEVLMEAMKKIVETKYEMRVKMYSC